MECYVQTFTTRVLTFFNILDKLCQAKFFFISSSMKNKSFLSCMQVCFDNKGHLGFFMRHWTVAELRMAQRSEKCHLKLIGNGGGCVCETGFVCMWDSRAVSEWGRGLMANFSRWHHGRLPCSLNFTVRILKPWDYKWLMSMAAYLFVRACPWERLSKQAAGRLQHHDIMTSPLRRLLTSKTISILQWYCCIWLEVWKISRQQWMFAKRIYYSEMEQFDIFTGLFLTCRAMW